MNVLDVYVLPQYEKLQPGMKAVLIKCIHRIWLELERYRVRISGKAYSD
jgi:hypothetical protein